MAQPRRVQVGPIETAPPAMAGAIDLNRIKDAPLTAQINTFNQQLMAAQILCDCGARITGDARMLYIRKERQLEIGDGENNGAVLGMGPGLGSTMVHSLFGCPKYAQIVEDKEVKIVAMRRVTEVEWCKDADTPVGVTAEPIREETAEDGPWEGFTPAEDGDTLDGE